MTLKKNDDIKKLYNAILKLQTEEECSMFFDDICTFQEKQEGRRSQDSGGKRLLTDAAVRTDPGAGRMVWFPETAH